MLTALRLGNFKAFGDAQRLPIKPLTLIFGANSAGKSSLIHSLVLAHHAMNSDEADENRLDVHRTNIGGESVDLGGFRQYVHKRNASNQVEWSAEIDASQLKGRVGELLASVSTVGVSVNIGLRQREKTTRSRSIDPRTGTYYQVPTGVLVAEGSPIISSYEITIDKKSILRASRTPEGYLQLNVLDHEHPVFQTIIKALVQSATTTDALSPEDFDSVNTAVAELVPSIAIQPGRFLPSGLVRSDDLRGISGLSMLRPISREKRQEDLAEAVSFLIPRTLDELISGLEEHLRKEFKRFHYLGPLRSYPPRHLAFAQYHDPNWHAGGGYAWDVVRRNERVRKAVNAWLGAEDRLQTPYELQLRKLFDVEDIREPVGQQARDYEIRSRQNFIAQVKDIASSKGMGKQSKLFEEFLEQQTLFDEIAEASDIDGSAAIDDEASTFLGEEELEELIDRAAEDIESVDELSLVDLRTGTKVSHRDVGIGVSQVLPVLVGAYSSQNKMIAVEQPEIHLHPKLQAELGDLFIESALGERRNTFLIETHSEHLILRLMRRMRDTVNDNLPAGLPPVRPEDVAVIYVQPKGSSSAVRVLELDEEGQLLDPFPGGFFEESFHERFA